MVGTEYRYPGRFNLEDSICAIHLVREALLASKNTLLLAAAKWRQVVAPGERRRARRVERNPGFTVTQKLATSDRFANLRSHNESQPIGRPA